MTSDKRNLNWPIFVCQNRVRIDFSVSAPTYGRRVEEQPVVTWDWRQLVRVTENGKYVDKSIYATILDEVDRLSQNKFRGNLERAFNSERKSVTRRLSCGHNF